MSLSTSQQHVNSHLESDPHCSVENSVYPSLYVTEMQIAWLCLKLALCSVLGDHPWWILRAIYNVRDTNSIDCVEKQML